MLTSEMLRVKQKGETLLAKEISRAERPRLLELAKQILDLFSLSIGQSREEILHALESVSCSPSDLIFFSSFSKIVMDESRFDSEDKERIVQARSNLFALAARKRKEHGLSYSRADVIELFAASECIDKFTLEDKLFSDLKQNECLTKPFQSSPEELLALYKHVHLKSILSYATKFEITFPKKFVHFLKDFLKYLKFLGLLSTVENQEDCYLISVCGPMSTFHQTRKYGIAFASVFSFLEHLAEYKLMASLTLSIPRKKGHYSFFHTKENKRGELDESVFETFIREHKKKEILFLNALSSHSNQIKYKINNDAFYVQEVGYVIPDYCAQIGSDCFFIEKISAHESLTFNRKIKASLRNSYPPSLFCVESKTNISERIFEEQKRYFIFKYKSHISAKKINQIVESYFHSFKV